MRFARAAVLGLILAVGLALGLGFLGAIHPAGDSLAVFRAQLAGALAVLSVGALALRMRRVGGVGLLLGLVAGVPVLLAFAGEGQPGAFRHYQKNLLFRNESLAAAEADLRAVAPDFVTLQEVSRRNAPILLSLSDVLPTHHFCRFASVGGVAVLSRFPAVPDSRTCAAGLAAVQVITPQGPVWVVSIHLHWPWPFRQAAQVDGLIPVLADLDGPKVVGGDFNMVPWSSVMRRMSRAAGMELATPAHGTLPRFGPLVPLPIDHVLTPAGGQSAPRPAAGSDHWGLLVTFDMPE